MSILKRTELKTQMMSPKMVNSPKLNIMGRQNAQFPGANGIFKNESIEEIRSFIKNQKKLKGFLFAVPAGATQFPLQVSGEARLMLGISLLMVNNPTNPALQPTSFTLEFNNETVINQVHPAMLSQEYMDDEYYQFLRPMSGQDDVSVTFTSAVAQTVVLAFYYL